MAISDITNSWFADHMATGPIARYTEAYNQAVEAMPALIAALGDDPPPAAPIADVVNGWFGERIATGPISRHPEAYDQAIEALPALIAALGDNPAPTALAATPVAAKDPDKAAATSAAAIKK